MVLKVPRFDSGSAAGCAAMILIGRLRRRLCWRKAYPQGSAQLLSEKGAYATFFLLVSLVLHDREQKGGGRKTDNLLPYFPIKGSTWSIMISSFPMVTSAWK